MKNHVFLIQAHKEPELLYRILKRLERENHYFIINIDKKTHDYAAFETKLNCISNVISLTRKNIMHGGGSQVACTLDQIRFALDYSVKFEYFHSISGQDYPCVKNDEFDHFFDNTETSFMYLDSPGQIEEWRNNKYSDRIERWNFVDNFNGPIGRYLHINGILRRLLRKVKRPHPLMDKIWGGWNWFSLQRNVVEYFMNYCNDHPEYLKSFRNTFCCDELVYATILYYRRQELNIEVRNSLRFIRWEQNGIKLQSPMILNEKDYEAIVNSGCFFCRKVESSESLKLMDMLDQKS